MREVDVYHGSALHSNYNHSQTLHSCVLSLCVHGQMVSASKSCHYCSVRRLVFRLLSCQHIPMLPSPRSLGAYISTRWTSQVHSLRTIHHRIRDNKHPARHWYLGSSCPNVIDAAAPQNQKDSHWWNIRTWRLVGYTATLTWLIS